MALLFSHVLTEEQKQEAREEWEIGTFLPLPADLQSRWSQVPPEGPFPREWLQPVMAWLSRETEPGDIVLVQGEFGAVYQVVSWCHREGRIPVYATTARRYESRRQPDGTVKNIHLFRHVNFRRYPRG
ncbi:MAG: CRISPR-associated protein Csx20 [Planifilum sp.]|jgi:hypothetical protein